MYSFKTHWIIEKIHRRLIYRCRNGYYTPLDFVVSDGHDEWDKIMRQLAPSFSVVYPNYDVEYNLAYQMERKYNARRYRYRKYVKKIVENLQDDDTLFFASWTIADKYIGLQFDTLKKYFRDNINLWGVNWLACEDYGMLNGRLHFHAIVSVSHDVRRNMYYEKVKRKKFLRLPKCYQSPYGFVDFSEIKGDSLNRRFNYTIGCVSYGLKAKKGFEGYKPFHNRNFVYRLRNDDCL